jgi:hypothetical protein
MFLRVKPTGSTEHILLNARWIYRIGQTSGRTCLIYTGEPLASDATWSNSVEVQHSLEDIEHALRGEFIVRDV